MAEWKIGEIKQINGEWYQCIVAIQGCRECSFRTQDYCTRRSECMSIERSDGKSVIFKKLEKVGEPYEYYVSKKGIILVQDYLLADPNHTVYNKKIEGVYDYLDGKVVIQIEQTKEDMEEKKIQLKQEDIDYLTRKIRYLVYKTNDYDRATEEIMNLFIPSDTEHSNSEKIGKNLKPFDLEAAKLGKPVCTRDGRTARIICFDKKCLDEQILIVLVDCGKEESIYFYTTDGKCIDDFSSFDLMMLPEKKEGWILLRKDGYTFDNEEVAKKNCTDEQFVAKVEWEE